MFRFLQARLIARNNIGLNLRGADTLREYSEGETIVEFRLVQTRFCAYICHQFRKSAVENRKLVSREAHVRTRGTRL